MIKIVKENIGLHYLLIEIHLHTLILLELNIFIKKYLPKSEINQLLTIYLEYVSILLKCFHRIHNCSENFVRLY